MCLAKQASEQLAPLDIFRQGSSSRAETGYGPASERSDSTQVAIDEPMVLSAVRNNKPTGADSVVEMFRALLFGAPPKPRPTPAVRPNQGWQPSVFGFRRENATAAMPDIGHVRWT